MTEPKRVRRTGPKSNNTDNASKGSAGKRRAGLRGLPLAEQQQMLRPDADEMDIVSYPAVDALGTETMTRNDFLGVAQNVETIAGAGALDLTFPGEAFADSRRRFQRHADVVNTYGRRCLGRSGPFAAESAALAQRDVAWYETRGVDVTVLENDTRGWFGMYAQSDATWLRLIGMAKTRGIDFERMPGGASDEAQLDPEAMGGEAGKLGFLVELGGEHQVGLGGSSLKVRAAEYANAWQEVTTTQGGTVAAMLSARRAANASSDDKDEARLKEIQSVIALADTVGGTVNSVMGNLTAVNQGMKSWETEVQASSVQVGSAMDVAVKGPSMRGPDTLKNLKATSLKVAGMAGKAASFIYADEIRRIQTAIVSVKAREATFASVVSNFEGLQKLAAFRDALGRLNTAAEAMKAEAETMRRAHLNLGLQIDKALRGNEAPGTTLSSDKEAAAPPMMLMGLVRESLAYTNTQASMGQTVLQRAEGLSGGVRFAADTQRGNLYLDRVAGYLAHGSPMGESDQGEYARYLALAKAARAICRRTDRRRAHLTELNGAFEEGLGSLGSTDGKGGY